MYIIYLKKDRQYDQGEYGFRTKKEAQEFLESLNPYQLENIQAIEKYNKKSFRTAWKDFFNY